MNNYTFADVIFDPTSEKARNYIGKMVYFADNPTDCLTYANSGYDDMAMILESIQLDSNFPFRLGAHEEYYFSCIIPKKEESEPEYVPFDNIEELIEASLEHNKSHSLSKVHGIWLKNKEDGTTSLITSINENTNYLYFNLRAESLEDIFCNYCFLDDTPCGKLQEVNNE